MDTSDRRVKFDFEIEFSNGGALQGQDFRLDIGDNEIADDELAAHLIRDMGLLMVGTVRILNKEIIFERHKKSRAATGAGPDARTRIDLSHTGRGRHDHLPRSACAGDM